MNIEVFLGIVIPLSLYFIIALLGSFIGDIANTINGKDTKFRFNRVLTGAAFGAFLMLGTEKWLLERFHIYTVILLTFIVGVIGFDLFNRVCKISVITEIISTITGGKITISTNLDDKDKDINK